MEIQEKPGSIKLQAQGSSDGDFPSVSFVSGPRDEVNSSAIYDSIHHVQGEGKQLLTDVFCDYLLAE